MVHRSVLKLTAAAVAGYVIGGLSMIVWSMYDVYRGMHDE